MDELVERVFARYIKKWSDEFKLDESRLTPEELGKRLVKDFLSKNNAEKSFNQWQRIILVSSKFDEQTLDFFVEFRDRIAGVGDTASLGMKS